VEVFTGSNYFISAGIQNISDIPVSVPDRSFNKSTRNPLFYSYINEGHGLRAVFGVFIKQVIS